jgi:hypothetical protein
MPAQSSSMRKAPASSAAAAKRIVSGRISPCGEAIPQACAVWAITG